MTNYSCSFCAKKNTKLWRETHVKNIKLKCADCLGALDVDQDGKVPTNTGSRTDKIGSWIPAVPMKDDEGGFWGYFSIPDTDAKWWRGLSSK